MNSIARLRFFASMAFVAGAIGLNAFAAIAQTPAALPTAPGIDALVALPTEYGPPLDPYLFVFLFIGGGMLCLIAVVVTNQKVISEYDMPDKKPK